MGWGRGSSGARSPSRCPTAASGTSHHRIPFIAACRPCSRTPPSNSPNVIGRLWFNADSPRPRSPTAATPRYLGAIVQKPLAIWLSAPTHEAFPVCT